MAKRVGTIRLTTRPVEDSPAITEEQIAALSDEAKAIGGSWFGAMHPQSGELVFAMVEYRPTAKAQAGLDALLAAGLISKTVRRGGAVVYRPLVIMGPLMKWIWERIDDPQQSFKLVEPITATPPAGDPAHE